MLCKSIEKFARKWAKMYLISQRTATLNKGQGHLKCKVQRCHSSCHDEQIQHGPKVDQHHQTAVRKSQQWCTCARYSGRLVSYISRGPPGLPPLTDPVQNLPLVHNARCPWKTPWYSKPWWSGHHKPLVRWWHWRAGGRRTRTCQSHEPPGQNVF